MIQPHHASKEINQVLSTMTSIRKTSTLQPGGPRTRTGCIGCRLRRKKCGEEKPRCAGCNRNGLLCTWPDADNSKHAELLRRTYLTCSKSQSLSLGKYNSQDVQGSFPPSRPPPFPKPPKFGGREAANMDLDDDISSIIPKSLNPHLPYVNGLLRQPLSRKLFNHYLHKTHKIMVICQGTKNPFILNSSQWQCPIRQF